MFPSRLIIAVIVISGSESKSFIWLNATLFCPEEDSNVFFFLNSKVLQTLWTCTTLQRCKDWNAVTATFLKVIGAQSFLTYIQKFNSIMKNGPMVDRNFLCLDYAAINLFWPVKINICCFLLPWPKSKKKMLCSDVTSSHRVFCKEMLFWPFVSDSEGERWIILMLLSPHTKNSTVQ